VLHEILTGRLPFPCRGVHDYAQALLAGPAPDTRAIAPAVPEALARLCTAALARTPADRLPSVEALAAGVRAHEAAVRAEQETAGWLGEARAALSAAGTLRGAERLRQLDAAAAAVSRVSAQSERHGEAEALRREVERGREQALEERTRMERRRTWRRSGAVAGVLLVLLIAGAAVLIDARRREAVEAKARALAAQRRAEDVVGFLLGDLLEGLEPLGRQDLLAQVAERTRDYFESLPESERSAEDQDHRITALLNLGDVLRARGDLERAETSYVRAQETADALRAARPADRERRLRAAEAAARRARVVHERGDRTRAYDLVSAHLVQATALAQERPDDPRSVDVLGEAHSLFAEARLRQDDAAGALRHLRLAAEVSARAANLPPPSPRRRERALRARLAWMRWIEEPTAAAAEGQAALIEARALAAAEPGDTRWQDLVAEAQGRLVPLLGRAHDEAGAATAYREARALRERLCERDPGNAAWAEALVRLDLRRGDALLLAGDPSAAEPVLEQAHRGATALVRRGTGNAVWQHMVVDVCDRLGHRAEDVRDWRAAMRWRREAIAAARLLVERDPANPVWRYILGHSLCVLGAEARALEEHDTAFASFGEGLPLVAPTVEAAADRAWLAASWAEALALSAVASGHTEAELPARRLAVDLTRVALARPDAPRSGPHALAGRLEQLWASLPTGSAEARLARDEARTAYEALLAQHPGDEQARAALERLRDDRRPPR
jgi:tetratricopeptide (TPR) repeat protein